LAEANLHPDWVAGISIGAVNAAVIAGNPPERRVDRLREFWEAVSASPFGIPYLASLEIQSELIHSFANQVSSLGVLFGGVPGFFKPRVPPRFSIRTAASKPSATPRSPR
jgi:NTE family protein